MTAQANDVSNTLSQASDRTLGAWLVLSAFSFMFFLVTAATFTSLGVALPYMIQDLGWDWGVAGIGFSILGIACGVSGYVPAYLIRKWGVSSTIVLGSLLLSAGFLSLFSMDSFVLTLGGTVWNFSPLMAYYLGCALTGVGFTLVATVPGTYVIAGCFERDCEGRRSFNRIVKQALPMAHHAQHRTWDVPRSRHPRGVYWRIGLGAASPDE